MGLEKAIASGQEHRKPYHGAKAVCFNCRNHGTCDYCKGNRLHSIRKREAAAMHSRKNMKRMSAAGRTPPQMLLMKAFCRNKAQAGDPRSRADRRLASFRSMQRSGAEDEVLTLRLSRGS